MVIRKINTYIGRAKKIVEAFKSDNDGVAAIEFAFIAPIMIAFYFGMSEIAMAITADRQISHTASVVGDLTTQVSGVNQAEMESIMTAALTVIGASADTRGDVTIELNSYQMATDGSGTIDRIGYARMGPAISAGGPATFDPNTISDMISETSGAVVARVNYKYVPVTLKFVDTMTLSETFVLKPRKSISVAFDEGGKTTFTCTAKTDLSVTCASSA